MSKSVFQIGFRLGVLIFKQIESTRVVTVRHHIPHIALGMQIATFHGSYQILAKTQCIQGKVNGKQFIDNVQDANLFGSINIIQGFSRSQFFAIVKGTTKGFLQQRDGFLQLGIAPIRRFAIGRHGQTMRRFADRVQGRYQPISRRSTKGLIKGCMQRGLWFVTLDGVTLSIQTTPRVCEQRRRDRQPPDDEIVAARIHREQEVQVDISINGSYSHEQHTHWPPQEAW